MKETFLILTVVGLLALGLVTALRSGVVGQETGRDLRVLAGNLSALAVRLAGLGLGMLAVQRAIGSPSLLNW